MASNGNLPNYMLASIPGGKLRKDAALHWNAMHKEIKAKTGIDIRPTGPRSSYRSLYWQRYFYNTMARGMAAVPGTSNHGWGLAVDVATPAMAAAINKYGAKYGYQKAWSDAQHEWWHFKWREGNYNLRVTPNKYPVIKKGSKGTAVKRLQVYLRAAGYLRANRKVNGDYNVWVRRAVRKFQRDSGLTDNGIVNKKTWTALRRAAKRRLK
jgi:hypothetical protein